MAATVNETTTFARPPREVFDYVVDFTNLAEWDPTFDRSVRTDEGELGVGSTFEVTATVAGSSIEIRYEIEEYDRPRSAKLVGRADNFTSIDRIRVDDADGGSTLHWEATVDADAPIVDTLATPLFKLVAKAAIAGLRDELAV